CFVAAYYVLQEPVPLPNKVARSCAIRSLVASKSRPTRAPCSTGSSRSKENLAVTDEALLLTVPGASSEGNNVAKLLTFFGVSWRTLTTEESFVQNGAGHESSLKSRLICSSDIFLRLIEDLERNPEY